jgi:GTPase SAR1 family protein
MRQSEPVIENRLKQLELHLQEENPVLLSAVQSVRKLDQVAYQMGLMERKNSYATQIPWWPLIAVLGTFSAGKSTFINTYLGAKLQRSGNQAVDDKFTVVCFSSNQESRSLPGVALDSDPRFPFYKISSDIEQVAAGEGSRIDAYLQLKTCPSEALRGKILIDSPGFDADAQRTSTLKIADHIINLSDLVLVFFDARHPEPGAMQDTLDHLVSNTIQRPDSGKFLYILNQLDTTAREDNPEDVVAAWQRAMGERGLTAGRFFTIYNKEAAGPINDESLRQRYEKKCQEDKDEIYQRMQQVEVDRAYRIVGALEKAARGIENTMVPNLQSLMQRWRKRTLIGDGLVFGGLLAVFITLSIQSGQWQGLSYQAGWWLWLNEISWGLYVGGGILAAAVLAIHYTVRNLAAKSLFGMAKRLGQKVGADLLTAFKENIKPWRSIFANQPKGWGRRTQHTVTEVVEESDQLVQQLNDRFTNPSGHSQKPAISAVEPITSSAT